MVVESPRGKMESVLTITEDNGQLVGATDKDTFSINETQEGLSWESSLKTPMGSIGATYNATIDGNMMTGSMKMTSGMMSGREMKFTATKQ